MAAQPAAAAAAEAAPLSAAQHGWYRRKWLDQARFMVVPEGFIPGKTLKKEEYEVLLQHCHRQTFGQEYFEFACKFIDDQVSRGLIPAKRQKKEKPAHGGEGEQAASCATKQKAATKKRRREKGGGAAAAAAADEDEDPDEVAEAHQRQLERERARSVSLEQQLRQVMETAAAAEPLAPKVAVLELKLQEIQGDLGRALSQAREADGAKSRLAEQVAQLEVESQRQRDQADEQRVELERQLRSVIEEKRHLLRAVDSLAPRTLACISMLFSRGPLPKLTEVFDFTGAPIGGALRINITQRLACLKKFVADWRSVIVALDALPDGLRESAEAQAMRDEKPSDELFELYPEDDRDADSIPSLLEGLPDLPEPAPFTATFVDNMPPDQLIDLFWSADALGAPASTKHHLLHFAARWCLDYFQEIVWDALADFRVATPQDCLLVHVKHLHFRAALHWAAHHCAQPGSHRPQDLLQSEQSLQRAWEFAAGLGDRFDPKTQAVHQREAKFLAIDLLDRLCTMLRSTNPNHASFSNAAWQGTVRGFVMPDVTAEELEHLGLSAEDFLARAADDTLKKHLRQRARTQVPITTAWTDVFAFITKYIRAQKLWAAIVGNLPVAVEPELPPLLPLIGNMQAAAAGVASPQAVAPDNFVDLPD